MAKGRPRTLSDEQRLQNRENLDSVMHTFRTNTSLAGKIEKISKRYKSKALCIIDLIKTHPDFIEMFPVNKLTLKK